jgi:hypothetical protein
MVKYYFYTPNVSSKFTLISESEMTFGLLDKVKSAVLNNTATLDFSVIIVDSHVLKSGAKRGDFSINLDDENEVTYLPCLIVSNVKTKDVETTLFNNSNIWCRLARVSDLDADVSNAVKCFNECHQIGLYTQNSAEEYINYHLRIQKENYLHGSHEQVRPNLYASEVLPEEDKKKLKDKIEKAKDSGIEAISLKILLIDDKIGDFLVSQYDTNDTIKIDECNCDRCQSKRKDECKLKIIKELLASDLCLNRYWNKENIEAYHVQKVCNKKHTGTIPKILDTTNSVQIIGVKNVETAIRFLSDGEVKYDLILLDYFFKGEDSKQQGTRLLQFIDSNEDIDKELREKIRSNAGLENRFWIFPITAFAPAFLNHLQYDGISLLTNKWYTYPPTNPIVTPVRFLHNLNEFIGMMVDRSIYTIEQLKTFLSNTLKNTEINKDNFVAFMGAEYSRLIHLYGHKQNIERDKAKSLFAKFIWNHFYINENNEEIIRFNGNMCLFYALAANCIPDSDSKKRLREAFDTIMRKAERTGMDINDANKLRTVIDEFKHE